MSTATPTSIEHHVISWRGPSRIEEIYAWSYTLRVIKLIVGFLLLLGHLLIGINVIQILSLVRFLLSTWRSLPLLILMKVGRIMLASVWCHFMIWELRVMTLLCCRISITLCVKKESRSLSWILSPTSLD